MLNSTLLSSDGVSVNYMCSDSSVNKKWLILILPFGMKLNLADAFFNHFKDEFSVLTWEGRLVFDDQQNMITPADVSVDKHVGDLLALMDAEKIEKAQLIGYCSGAGIALAAINSQPKRFDKLILVHGEYTLFKEQNCMTQAGRDIDGLLPLAAKDLKMAQFVLKKIPPVDESKLTTVPEGVLLPYSNAQYFHRYATSYIAYKSMDYAQLAETISHPTYLLSGERDNQTNINSTKKIQQQLKNADVSEVYIDPDADHYGILRPASKTLDKLMSILQQE